MRGNNQKNLIISLLVSVVLLTAVIFLFSSPALAQVEVTGTEGMQAGLALAEEETGLGTADLRLILARIVRIFLGFLGIVAIILVMYGGFLWMTAAGEPEKINKAKRVLINAAIGLAIIISAFAIVQFVINSLLDATGARRRYQVPYQQGIGGLRGALGSGILKDHYPQRNQRDIPRNTKIVVSFKEVMSEETIINDVNGSGVFGDFVDGNDDGIMDLGEYDTINAENIKIYSLCTGEDETCLEEEGIDNALEASQVRASVTPDGQTFVFKPIDPLGSPENPMWYIVKLSSEGGDGGILTSKGIRAFDGGAGSNYYEWKFEVSTVLDLTPPQVVSAIPFPDDLQDSGGEILGARDKPRNAVIQINFSEAVDPTTVSGTVEVDSEGALLSDTFDRINVYTDDGFVAGNFTISNGYKTVEFVSSTVCEGVSRNSCGEIPYCLPGLSNIQTLIKAADLGPGGEGASIPYTGVVDMADNSFDGDKDLIAEGPVSTFNLNSSSGEGDNFLWSFWTSNEVDLVPPLIETIPPTAGVNLFNPLDLLFDKLMMSGTLNNSNIGILDFNGWFVIRMENINIDDIPTKTKAIIKHGEFEEVSDYGGMATSNIKDLYQNCFKPCAGPGCEREGDRLPYEAGDPWGGIFPDCRN